MTIALDGDAIQYFIHGDFCSSNVLGQQPRLRKTHERGCRSLANPTRDQHLHQDLRSQFKAKYILLHPETRPLLVH
jgi:hypothetical protein